MPPQTSTQTISISINDLNDESPTFDRFQILEKSLSENIADIKLIDFEISDVDSNSDLSINLSCTCYKNMIGKSCDNLVLFQNSIVVSKGFDFEEVSEVFCDFYAEDLAALPQFGSQKISRSFSL